MGKRNVRVDVPIGYPAQMSTLTQDILDEHNALGNNSPLLHLNMAGLQTQHVIHVSKRNEATTLHGQGEAAIQAADMALGVAKVQNVDTVGTVYYFVTRVRDTLLIFHENYEEEINNYGFEVVLGKVKGRTTVSVEIPIFSPEKMIKLTQAILDQHNALGNNSPLLNLNMLELQVQHDIHVLKRKEGNKLHGKAEAATQAANSALGTGKNQNVHTAGTIYNIVTRIRDTLLIFHQNFEEEMNNYGFNVVITQTGGTVEKITLTMATNQTNPDKVTIGYKGTANKVVDTAFGDGNSKNTTMDGIDYVLAGNTYLTGGNYTITAEMEKSTLDGIMAAGIFLTAVLHPDGLDAEEYDYSNNGITSIYFLPTNTRAKRIDVSGNNLDQQSMNLIMMTADGWGTSNGYIKADGGTNAPPSGQGIAAKNALIAKGWTVITN